MVNTLDKVIYAKGVQFKHLNDHEIRFVIVEFELIERAVLLT